MANGPKLSKQQNEALMAIYVKGLCFSDSASINMLHDNVTHGAKTASMQANTVQTVENAWVCANTARCSALN